MNDIAIVYTSDGYAKLRRHDFEALQAELAHLREVQERKGRKMITGFLAICPNCGKITQIPTKKIKDSTPLSDFPWWGRGSCNHCGAKILITLDVQVTSTRLDDPESSYKLGDSA